MSAEMPKFDEGPVSHDIIMLLGLAGTGKTTLVDSFPGPKIYIECGPDGGGTVLQNTKDVMYKNISATDNLSPAKNMIEFLKTVFSAMRDDKIICETLVIDTISAVQKHTVLYYQKKKGRALSLQERGLISGEMSELLDLITTAGAIFYKKGLKIVMLSHIKIIEIDGQNGENVRKFIPDMSESVGNAYMQFSDDVFYLSIDITESDEGIKSEFITHIGAHPRINTKVRSIKGAAKGIDVPDFNYQKMMELRKGKQIETVKIKEPEMVKMENTESDNVGKDEID